MAAYLQPQDYAAFGIPGADDAKVNAASTLIDGRIGRPDGLLWSPDANGQPAWMANKTATRAYSLPADIAAGPNTLTFAGANFGQGDVGSAVVIDRVNPSAAETCIITAASGNTLTLTTQFNHLPGATLEFGLTIAEDASVIRGGMVRTTARPLANLLSVTGSYRGRRHDRISRPEWFEEILSIGTDGDLWVSFPLSQCDIDATTGICWLLPGPIRAGFARVRLNYAAGWNYQNLPAQVKQACANLVNGMALSDEIPANIKMAKYGDATLVNFNSSLFDNDTDNLLAPYRNIRV